MRTLQHPTHTKGFTLVELMVTVAVMLIITSISFFNYSEFNSVTVTNSLAYDIALAIRQAQQYGVAVREVGDSSEAITINSDLSKFSKAYGIHFDQSNFSKFQLFADTLDSASGGTTYQYDVGEELQTYNLQQGSHIVSVCVTNVAVNNSCIGAGGFLDVMFQRPNPDSIVTYRLPDVTNDKNGDRGTLVDIKVANTSGTATKHILVYSSGQIAIQ